MNKRDKQIAYIQKALKLDAIKNPNRPLNEFTELCDLLLSQYKDMTSFTIVRSGKGEDVMDQKDTVSIEDCKGLAVDMDGKSIYRG